MTYPGPGYSQPSYPPPQPPPGQPPSGPPPGQPLPARPPKAGSIAGWVWPALVVAALLTGIVGGVLGGALVLGTGVRNDGGDVPEVSGARPLPADNKSMAAAAAKALPSTVQVKVINGNGDDVSGATGSGFVVDHQGHVITNAHVVHVLEGSGRITVVDNNGRTHAATVVGDSPVYDVAVLKISSPEGLRPVALGSVKSMRVGETVLVLGSPLGLTRSVTAGIVSALDRPVTTGSADESAYIDAVQTDAAINPGSSGGPLVNLRGQVVGMNSAIATTGAALGSEPGNIGVGFAIPIDQVSITVRQILTTGKAEYPVIGANIRTDELVQGATIVDVPSGTPADDAGLQKGDRIVAIDGTRVPDGVSLIVAIRSHRPGDVVELTVVRDGKQETVHVRLDAKVG